MRIWSAKRGDWLRLWVEDNGIGIAPEMQGKIFGVFVRLHGIETYPGTGNGLAIVRRATESMSGKFGLNPKRQVEADSGSNYQARPRSLGRHRKTSSLKHGTRGLQVILIGLEISQTTPRRSCRWR